jgi:predicted nucleotidyltransferase
MVMESQHMEVRSVEAIVRALNEANVRYLIAGGVAVVAHGYRRFTADLDLILDLEEENARKAVVALAGLGYRPRVPVPLEQFADPAIRAQWVRDKGLLVFSLDSPKHEKTTVDLFVESPLDFARAYGDAARIPVVGDLHGSFISLQDLMALKAKAGRPKDLIDLEYLQKVKEVRGDG